jgi:hypothetical protein
MGGRAAPDSLEEGHRTQEWLATADQSEISPRSGGYWYHRRSRQPHPAARSAQFQRELMDKLEADTGFVLSAGTV